MPEWIANDPELTKAQKQDYYRTIQFFGGKDPLALLIEYSKDIIKANATARHYHLSDTVKSEIYQLYKQDPILNNESALALRFRLRRERIAAILLLKKREEDMAARGELPNQELNKELDKELTAQLGAEADGRVINDDVLLRQNVISKPRISQIPAEANPRVMARVIPRATVFNNWKHQLPNDWKVEPILHKLPKNLRWDADAPLYSPVQIRKIGKPRDKTITRKLGQAFQNVNKETGAVSPATVEDAVRFMKQFRPLHKSFHSDEVEKNVEPLPEEVELEEVKQSLHPDLIHVSRFFRAITEELASPDAPESEELLTGSEVSMFDGHEDWGYLEYVKKPMLSPIEDPKGARSVGRANHDSDSFEPFRINEDLGLVSKEEDFASDAQTDPDETSWKSLRVDNEAPGVDGVAMAPSKRPERRRASARKPQIRMDEAPSDPDIWKAPSVAPSKALARLKQKEKEKKRLKSQRVGSQADASREEDE